MSSWAECIGLELRDARLYDDSGLAQVCNCGTLSRSARRRQPGLQGTKVRYRLKLATLKHVSKNTLQLFTVRIPTSWPSILAKMCGAPCLLSYIHEILPGLMELQR